MSVVYHISVNGYGLLNVVTWCNWCKYKDCEFVGELL